MWKSIRVSPFRNLTPYSAQRRQFSSTPKYNKLTASLSHASSNNGPNPQSMSKYSYLDGLSVKELVSYLFIGLSTTSKLSLNAAIKAFPYVPMPLIKAFVFHLYCGGETPAEVLATAQRLSHRGINNVMLSYTVEDSDGTKNLDVDMIVDETVKSIDTILIPHTVELVEKNLSEGRDPNEIPPAYLALKPSALVENPAEVMLNYTKPEWNAQWRRLVENHAKVIERISELNTKLAAKYPSRKTPFVVAVVDAEKYDLQQAVYVLQRELFQKFNKERVSVVGTIQMYLQQSADVLANEAELAKENGYKLGLKLVRGAYIHSEPDRKNVIHTTKAATDVNYDKGMEFAIKKIGANEEVGHLVVASHNEQTMNKATDFLEPLGQAKCHVTLAQLLGMADDVTHSLVTERGVKNVIKYVPWGPPLETKDYLLRRLEENGDAVRSASGWSLVFAAFKALLRRAV